MRRFAIAGIVGAILTLLAGVQAPSAAVAEPLSRCIGVEPICPPGKHAICICESDYSFKCQWVCASQ
jgi:hypothetical protein